MDSDPNCYRCVADTPSEKRCLFAEGSVRAWIDNYPQVCVDVLAELRGGLRVTSDPEGRPLAGTVGTTKSRRDGTEAGCWLWWKGKRHDVPKGVVYRLLEYFWNRDSAGYDELNISVFDSSVQPSDSPLKTLHYERSTQKDRDSVEAVC